MNEAFQEYKRNYDIHCATLVIKDRGIEAQALKEDESIEMELPEEIERGYIEVEPMTSEEQRIYEEHNKKRYEKLIQHPKWENARKRMEGEER